ncbi:MAG: tRNA pseudouridine(38-40) synthase TruA [Desulfobulbaceae bacterium]|nr:tRNA pseudouridine(38-40) synthase TruA [Desulfobulbaceae bacterium]
MSKAIAPKKAAPKKRPPVTKETVKSHKYRLNLEYDGTKFSGWQKQDDAKSIQGALLTAAAELFLDQEVDVQGCGRTDAGVHALNYTAHLESSNGKIPPAIIRKKLNDLLPPAIVVLGVEPCPPRFHARHSCLGRSYLYQIAHRKTAFQKKYVWWVKEPLNVKAMAEAAQVFTGMHDFTSFAEKQELKKSTQVLLNGVFLYEDEEMLRLRVVGSHFLWKMVRRMAGVLVEVGKGNLTAKQVAAFLETTSTAPSRLTAPPSGLFFEKAFYDQKELDKFLAAAQE